MRNILNLISFFRKYSHKIGIIPIYICEYIPCEKKTLFKEVKKRNRET
jgi:hypothetical protein